MTVTVTIVAQHYEGQTELLLRKHIITRRNKEDFSRKCLRDLHLEDPWAQNAVHRIFNLL